MFYMIHLHTILHFCNLTDMLNCHVAFINVEKQTFLQIIGEHVSSHDGEQVYFLQEIDRRVSEPPRITRIAHSVYADTDLTVPNAHTSAARGM